MAQPLVNLNESLAPAAAEEFVALDQRALEDLAASTVAQTLFGNPMAAYERHQPGLRLVPTEVTEVITAETITAQTNEIMQEAGRRFMETVKSTPVVEPTNAKDRYSRVEIEQQSITPEFVLSDGWHPATVNTYKAITDPFQDLNPELTQAATELIETTMARADELALTGDATLTYLTSQRGGHGKRNTALTNGLCAIDEGIADWINNLPDAERLRPVAAPWSDTNTVVSNGPDKGFTKIPITPALQALIGGSHDGRAVRIREGWEHAVLDELNGQLTSQVEADGELRLTSLGTGTGEPGMDVGADIVRGLAYKGNYPAIVTGFDIMRGSLAVAAHLAEERPAVTFVPRHMNLLEEGGVTKAIEQTQPHAVEGIGLNEYIASDYATSPIEIQQREAMKAAGYVSAETFYGDIYRAMPKGSVLLTGNYRDDAPQDTFVTQGLGWKGIIQRSTEEFLGVMQHAGIPGEAVHFYVPAEGEPGAVYNMAMIVKQ